VLPVSSDFNAPFNEAFTPASPAGEFYQQQLGDGAEARAAVSPATILVVEDDPDVRALVVELLAGWGYRVLSAVDGAMALAILDRDRSIRLMFSDVVMPGKLSGGELAERARRLRPDLKVLLTSGFAEHPAVRSAPIDGIAAFIAKPYRPRELAAQIRQVLAE
jgi:CheY-like chemotaxis protein